MFKKILGTIVLALALSVSASAHSTTLTFNKSTDDTGAAGQGYTAWRLTGTCPATVTDTTGFTALNSTLFTGTSFVDSTVTPGNYCYVVTFTSSAQSVPSNTAGAAVLPAAPTNVKVTSVN